MTRPSLPTWTTRKPTPGCWDNIHEQVQVPMKKLRRALWIGLAIVVVIGVLAPYLDANRLRPRIQAALEAAFNRPVQIEEVHLNLFTGPGFTVKNVLIGEDPAAGIEPFAHVEFMQA